MKIKKHFGEVHNRTNLEHWKVLLTNLLNFGAMFHKKLDRLVWKDYKINKNSCRKVQLILYVTCSGKCVILDHLRVHGRKKHRVTSSHFPQNYQVSEVDISKATYTNSCYKTTFKSAGTHSISCWMKIVCSILYLLTKPQRLSWMKSWSKNPNSMWSM